MPAGGSCNVVVSATLGSSETLSSKSVTSKSNTSGFYEELKIVLNGSDETTMTINLVASKVGGVALMKMSSHDIIFLNVDSSIRTEEKKLTITNVGTSEMTLGIPESNCFDKSVNSTCGESIGAGKSCDLIYSINLAEALDKSKEISNNPPTDRGKCYDTFYGMAFKQKDKEGEELGGAFEKIFIDTNASNVNDYASIEVWNDETFKLDYPHVKPEDEFKAMFELMASDVKVFKDKVLEFESPSIRSGGLDYRYANAVYMASGFVRDKEMLFSVKVTNKSNDDIKLDNFEDDIIEKQNKGDKNIYKLMDTSTCRKGYVLKAGKSCTALVSVIIDSSSSESGTGITFLIKKGSMPKPDGDNSYLTYGFDTWFIELNLTDSWKNTFK